MSKDAKNAAEKSSKEAPKESGEAKKDEKAPKDAKKEEASGKSEEVKGGEAPKEEKPKAPPKPKKRKARKKEEPPITNEFGDRPAIAKKKAQVEEFRKELSSTKNIVVLDLRKLPDRLLQGMRKKLREGGTKIRMAQSTVLRRALEGAGKPRELIDLFDKPAALVFTEMTPVELNSFFRGNTMDVAAKPGQVAPEDIVVPAGETSLPPGPALSELKAAGINAQIRGPKISVVKDSTVVKAGEEITLEKAKALQTLGIKPFKVHANILLAYDGEYVYAPDLLGISAESLAPEFVASLRDAFNVSVNASYPSGNSIELLVTTALVQGTSVGINGEIYSPASIEQLLARSIRGGLALSELNPEAAPAKEAAAGEPKPEEKAEEPAAKAAEESKPDTKEEPKAEKPAEAPKAGEPKAETPPDASAGEGKKETEKPETGKEPEESGKKEDSGKPEEKKGE
jgi:large subunit ribosomal protein L10